MSANVSHYGHTDPRDSTDLPIIDEWNDENSGMNYRITGPDTDGYYTLEADHDAVGIVSYWACAELPPLEEMTRA